MTDKPLFIPLMAKWYEAFARGEKDTEYRVYGPRWNENTCYPGRAVVLSYGYGKARRIFGIVDSFQVVGPDASPAIAEVFPGEKKIAAIGVRICP